MVFTIKNVVISYSLVWGDLCFDRGHREKLSALTGDINLLKVSAVLVFD